MAEAWHLSLEFVADHPAEAARVLESIASAHAAAFLGSLPAGIGASVLAAMLPSAAARIIGATDPASASLLLDAAGTQSAVAILRHVAEPARAQLLAGLRPAAAATSHILLGFGADTVGAWTDPDVPALSPELDAAAALTRVQETGSGGLPQVFAVDDARRLLGSVALEALIRAAPADRMGQLLHPVVSSLPAMMPIAVARELGAWAQAIALPVIDHDGRLIGVLRRTALAQAGRGRTRATVSAEGAPSVAGALASGYWGIVAALSSALLALLPGVSRVAPEE